MEELPYLWRDAYEKMTLRPTSIVRIRHNSFNYIYDNYSYLESTGAVPYDPVIEDRLVAVLGLSGPRKMARDDYRLKGWVGPTEKTYGRRWDKGHFIAHSIGGAVDRLEVNVFVQRRDLNRGWSAEGKRYPPLAEKWLTSSKPERYLKQIRKVLFLRYIATNATGNFQQGDLAKLITRKLKRNTRDTKHRECF